MTHRVNNFDAVCHAFLPLPIISNCQRVKSPSPVNGLRWLPPPPTLYGRYRPLLPCLPVPLSRSVIGKGWVSKVLVKVMVRDKRVAP